MKPETHGLGRVNGYRYLKRGKWRFEARWRDLDGRLYRKTFTSRDAFNFFRTEKAIAIANGRSARFRLSEAEAASWERMKDDAARFGLTIEEIYWAASERRRAAARPARSITVPRLVVTFLRSKRGQGLSPYHLRDLRARLRPFAAAFRLPANHVSPDLIQEWLNSLGTLRSSVKIGPRTWNNYLAAVLALAKFGRDQKLCAWDLASIERRNLPDAEPAIFTPSELRLLLEASADGLQRCLAISAFAGLRSEEVSRLKWEDFDWDNQVIFLRRAIVKGQAGQRSSRSVPLRPNLAEWLAPWRRATGPVSPYKDSKSLAGMKWNTAQRLGLKWQQNAPRHSWISYQLAETGDIHQVATLAGNSPKMIKDHYLKLVTPAASKQWFNIRPANTSAGQLALNFRVGTRPPESISPATGTDFSAQNRQTTVRQNAPPPPVSSHSLAKQLNQCEGFESLRSLHPKLANP